MTPEHHANPDLTVLADNKQGWNLPERRRHGFHNADRLWRRMFQCRARSVLTLHDRPDSAVADAVQASGITRHPAFSALVIAEGNRQLYGEAAADFATTQSHSIQSVTKMHAHLLLGELIAAGRVDPELAAGHYLPDLGPGYAQARIADLLDMTVINDFDEDYSNPFSACYAEEEALGWRLPADGRAEITLAAFTNAITGSAQRNTSGLAGYKSANTDVLTRIAAAVSPVYLATWLERVADAAGYEGTFSITLSPELLPALSGGGCLSARDLARFGLLLARRGAGLGGGQVGDAGFTAESLTRPAPKLSEGRYWLRYSRHLMTDGRRIGHAGYGGQYLMVDMETGRVAAFLSVLENASGYDDDYMAGVIRALETVLNA
ncbi:MAG: serine hydrolase domain-containing protein [Paracoccaceae bacterium]